MTWFLIVSTLCCSLQLLREPFLFNEDATSLYVVCAVNAGRYAFKTARELLMADRAPSWYIHVIHHVVALMLFGVMATCREDALLGVIFTFMEAHTVFHDVAYVMRKIDFPHRRSLLAVASVGFCTCVLVRAFLPVTLFVVAAASHSPLRMSPVPLSVLFTSVIFFSFVNAWSIRQAALTLLGCVRERQIGHLMTAQQLKRHPPLGAILPAELACNSLTNSDIVTFLRNDFYVGEAVKPNIFNVNIATVSASKKHKTHLNDILLDIVAKATDTRTDPANLVPTCEMHVIQTDQYSTTRIGNLPAVQHST